MVVERPGPQVPHVVRRWHKRLRAIDAQHGTSRDYNRSNTATLVQAGHPIDRETWFRDDLFGELDWAQATSRGARAREVAESEAEVGLEGESWGVHTFEVRHTPGYEAGQQNRTTELQWGSLAPHMRAEDHTGDFLTIEGLSDGTFRLHLSREPTGEFIR
jgi:hypothetical protein